MEEDVGGYRSFGPLVECLSNACYFQICVNSHTHPCTLG